MLGDEEVLGLGQQICNLPGDKIGCSVVLRIFSQLASLEDPSDGTCVVTQGQDKFVRLPLLLTFDES